MPTIAKSGEKLAIKLLKQMTYPKSDGGKKITHKEFFNKVKKLSKGGFNQIEVAALDSFHSISQKMGLRKNSKDSYETLEFKFKDKIVKHSAGELMSRATFFAEGFSKVVPTAAFPQIYIDSLDYNKAPLHIIESQLSIVQNKGEDVLIIKFNKKNRIVVKGDQNGIYNFYAIKDGRLVKLTKKNVHQLGIVLEKYGFFIVAGVHYGTKKFYKRGPLEIFGREFFNKLTPLGGNKNDPVTHEIGTYRKNDFTFKVMQDLGVKGLKNVTGAIGTPKRVK